MKKTLISCATFAMLGVGVLLYSCQKIQPTTGKHPVETNAFNISVEDNRLAFASVEDYEKAVNNPSEETVKSVLKTTESLSFASLRKSRSNKKDLIKSDYFAGMLNEDFAVQIGKHIYKINPETENVHVLPVSHASEYASLIAEDVSNKHISVYSAGEEVLALVNNGQTSQATTRCKETGIGGTDVATTVYKVASDSTLIFQGQLHFNRYGIHFSLWAEGKIHNPSQSNPTHGIADVHITLTPVYYHVRCKNTVGPYYPDGGKENGYRRYSSYQGTRSLNEVYFRAKFEIVESNSSTVKQETEYIEIRQNY